MLIFSLFISLSQPQSISFGEQVDYYLAVQKELVQKLGASRAQTHLSKSLFIIVIGSNDIYTYFDSSINNRTSPQQYVNSMAAALKQQVKVTNQSINNFYNHISEN